MKERAAADLSKEIRSILLTIHNLTIVVVVVKCLLVWSFSFRVRISWTFVTECGIPAPCSCLLTARDNYPTVRQIADRETLQWLKHSSALRGSRYQFWLRGIPYITFLVKFRLFLYVYRRRSWEVSVHAGGVIRGPMKHPCSTMGGMSAVAPRSLPGNLPHSSAPPPFFSADPGGQYKVSMAGSSVWKVTYSVFG